MIDDEEIRDVLRDARDTLAAVLDALRAGKPVDLEQVAAIHNRLELRGLGDGSNRCSGLTARWCPACGTCTCGDDLATPGCPLHDPTSRHADEGEAEVMMLGLSRDDDDDEVSEEDR